MFVCGVSLANTSELYTDCLKVMLFALFYAMGGGEGIYEMICLF